jgi:hypothetical protein
VQFNQQNILNDPVRMLTNTPQRFYPMPETQALPQFIQQQNARAKPTEGPNAYPYHSQDQPIKELQQFFDTRWPGTRSEVSGTTRSPELYQLNDRVHGASLRVEALQQAVNKGWRPPALDQVTPRGRELFETKQPRPPQLTLGLEGQGSKFDHRSHATIVAPEPDLDLDPALTAIHEADHALSAPRNVSVRPSAREQDMLTDDSAVEIPPSLADVANPADVVKHHSGIILNQPLGLGRTTLFRPDQLRRSLEQVGYYNSPMTAAEAFNRPSLRALLESTAPAPAAPAPAWYNPRGWFSR